MRRRHGHPFAIIVAIIVGVVFGFLPSQGQSTTLDIVLVRFEAAICAKSIRVYHSLPAPPRLQLSCYDQSYDMNDFTLQLLCTIQTTDHVVTFVVHYIQPSSYPQVYCLYYHVLSRGPRPNSLLRESFPKKKPKTKTNYLLLSCFPKLDCLGDSYILVPILRKAESPKGRKLELKSRIGRDGAEKDNNK